MTDGWLTGWKAIGNYLGVCARSAMRYADNYGMPAKRLPSGKVTVLKEELKQWRIKYNEKEKAAKHLS